MLGSMAIRALSLSPLDSIAVVVHPDDPLDWLPALGNSAFSASPSAWPSIQVVTCTEASQGMSFSIRCGLKALIDDNPKLDAVVVVLADQPFITTGMIAELIGYLSERPELDYVATATDVGGEGEQNAILMPPAILSRSMFEVLLQLEGDAGARKLFGLPQFRGAALLAADRTTVFDVDTPADMVLATKQILGQTYIREHRF
ncbi:molybdenum cofactor cytidylyltransferase [Paenibacillus prosopidis]|uniref:Molybdenum cofactor cytidylyltransferase n=2 Tax=Paenibacillus prosopidis TaxID=630520 RepID=A0A368W5A4_9BACL|nr:molybdenum cofactor cytidylyltransferase [Paenibacillus prosopidis]